MDPLKFNTLTRPVTTGIPSVTPDGAKAGGIRTEEDGESFLSVLQQKLEAGSNTSFSKHAVARVHERQIDVSDTNLVRLNHGIRLAQEKGLKDALILIDQSAYIVNANAGKVVTVDGEATNGSVFTNIDGTVIV